jgi:hypothetical protein
MLNIFALIVLIVLLAAVLAVAAFLGAAPGRIARERNHPQADAINVCGWLGLITLGVPWIVAMVWAYAKPVPAMSESNLAQRVDALEEEIRKLRATGGAP